MSNLSMAINGMLSKEQILVAMSVGESEVVSVDNATENVSPTASSDGEDEKGGGAKWILPIILLALLGVFLWYWLNHDNDTKEKAAESKAKTEMTSAADSTANALNAELSSGASADTMKGK